MTLSPEAEAEIERLFTAHKSEVDFPDWFAYVLDEDAGKEALRAAMRWAYEDAAKIADEIVLELGADSTNSWYVGAAHCAAAIKRRAELV